MKNAYARRVLEDRLAGPVVEAPASRPANLGLIPSFPVDLSGDQVTPVTGDPVATLPGAWHYRVRAGTGWPGASIL